MTPTAASLLVTVRRGAPRLASLPAELAPSTLSDAYAVQRAVFTALGERIGGWKATLFDASHGICAPIAGTALWSSPAQVSPASTPTRGTRRFGIEPEIAFRLGTDLPPLPGELRYSEQQVWAAVESAHAAIEVVVSRYIDSDAVTQLERVADNFMNEGLVLGPATPNWSELPMTALPLQVLIDGVPVHQGVGGHPVGSPLLPLLWIANHLSQLGTGLARGAVITTGSCNGVRYLAPGQSVQAAFTGLGSAQLNLIED